MAKVLLDPGDLFGRIPQAPKPTHFQARAVLEEVPRPVRDFRFWKAITALKQRGPSCIGHTGTHFEGCAPIMVKPWDDPYDLYHEAQAYDPWAGTPHDGSTVEALAKALRARGRILTYHWGHTKEDLRDWVLTFGTAMMGTAWLQGMMTVDKRGFVKVEGPEEGGHAYLIIGYSKRLRAFRILNSWGLAFGERGRAWIHEDGMAYLMSDRWAEMLLALEERLAPRKLLEWYANYRIARLNNQPAGGGPFGGMAV